MRCGGGLSEADSERVGGLVKEVEGLLSDIIARDNEDRKRLEAANGAIKGELGRVAAAGSAVQAYGARGGGGKNRLTDQQG